MFNNDYTLLGLKNVNKTNCDNYGGSDSENIYIAHSPYQMVIDQENGYNIFKEKGLYLTWGIEDAEEIKKLGFNAKAVGSVTIANINKIKEGKSLVYIPVHPYQDGTIVCESLSENELLKINKKYQCPEVPIISTVDIHRNMFQDYSKCQVIKTNRFGSPLAHINKMNYLINNASIVVCDVANTFYYIAKHFGLEVIVLNEDWEKREYTIVDKGIDYIQDTINERLGIKND